MRTLIEVWVCPTPDCPDYYGALSIEGENLGEQMNRDIKSKPTFSRAVCQMCKSKGINVERECRYAVVLDHGPEQPTGPTLAVQEAYKILRKAGHSSVT
jgi:hypothetical protein